jgi:hypothetical protein
MIGRPRTAPPTERKEWLESPRKILVRQRPRLGRRYYVLRPLAIVYASVFVALREVAVVVIYAGLWAFWLIAQVLGWFLGGAAWLLIIYTRVRRGRQAADELRRLGAQSETEGQAWAQRATARLARRVRWPSDVEPSDERPVRWHVATVLFLTIAFLLALWGGREIEAIIIGVLTIPYLGALAVWAVVALRGGGH